MKETLYASLERIVGKEFISDQPEELFLYTHDHGAEKPGRADCLVMPGSAGEVRKILGMAHRHKIPVTTVGAGLNLSGLTIPGRGGIVLDMRRMDAIIEVNELSRYVVVEPGVSIGKLIGYLKKNHPGLRISVPDAPPTATITGNLLFSGSGHLSKYGMHSEMINGLEAVLPGGEVCRAGSCALSPYWFGKSPLPDLTGLFVNWYGTTGVVTRLSLKLYPRPKIREIFFWGLPDAHVMPRVIQRLTETELVEDILILVNKRPGDRQLTNLLTLYVTADTPRELDLKTALFKEILTGGTMKGKGLVLMPNALIPPRVIADNLAEPKYGMEIADMKKGGGFEYLGVALPLELIPKAYEAGCDIASAHDFDGPIFGIRNIGIGQGVMFTFGYPFNRVDDQSLENCRQAMAATTRMALDIGGVPWKPAKSGQQMMLEQMFPGTRQLMAKIKKTIDPNGIMNPGHWEI